MSHLDSGCRSNILWWDQQWKEKAQEHTHTQTHDTTLKRREGLNKQATVATTLRYNSLVFSSFFFHHCTVVGTQQCLYLKVPQRIMVQTMPWARNKHIRIFLSGKHCNQKSNSDQLHLYLKPWQGEVMFFKCQISRSDFFITTVINVSLILLNGFITILSHGGSF